MMQLFLDRQEAEDLYRYLEPVAELDPVQSEYLKRLAYLRRRCWGYLKTLEEKNPD